MIKKSIVLLLVGTLFAGPAVAALSSDDQEIHDAIKESCKAENFYDPGDAIGTCFLDNPCEYDRNNASQKKLMQPFCRHFNDSEITPSMVDQLGTMYCGGSYTTVSKTDSKLIFKCSDNRRFSIENFYLASDDDTAERRLYNFCKGFHGSVEGSGTAQYIEAYVHCKVSEKVCNGSIKKAVLSMKDLTKASVTYKDGICEMTGEDEVARKKWDNQ